MKWDHMGKKKKNLPAMQEILVWSLGWEDLLEKEMATHSSILAWRIPWTEEPGGLQSMGLPRVGHDWVTKATHPTWKAKGYTKIQNWLKMYPGIEMLSHGSLWYGRETLLRVTNSFLFWPCCTACRILVPTWDWTQALRSGNRVPATGPSGNP